MQTKNILKTTAFALVIGLMAQTSLATNVSAAERSAEFVTGKGKTGAIARTRDGNLRDGLNRSKTVTGPNGESYEVQSTVTYDKETGTYNKTVTGADGKAITYNGTIEDGQKTGTYTTADGKTGTYETGVTKNDDGEVTRSNTWTNEAGETKNRSATYEYEAETGEATRVITNNRGKIRAGSVSKVPSGE